MALFMLHIKNQVTDPVMISERNPRVLQQTKHQASSWAPTQTGATRGWGGASTFVPQWQVLGRLRSQLFTPSVLTSQNQKEVQGLSAV